MVGEAFGAVDPEAAARQVARVLSLDHDGAGFPAVGERDPVIGRLQARFPGLRPVLFFSPYEAAAWTLIGHRVRIAQAARVKQRLAEEVGEVVDIHGDVRHAFPTPQRLAGLDSFPGLFGRKPEWLRALAAAAIEGQLDPDQLRAKDHEEALAGLKRLPGIGDFSAELVFLRGAGVRDVVPVHERRLRRAVALAYGLDREPGVEDLRRIAEAWRPYRTWVSVLLRSFLEQETGEISRGGTRAERR